MVGVIAAAILIALAPAMFASMTEQSTVLGLPTQLFPVRRHRAAADRGDDLLVRAEPGPDQSPFRRS